MAELFPYQEEGVKFLRQRSRAYLADEMGLGKSVQLIRASRGKTLVIAPAMLLDTGTWQGEIDKWADDPSRFTLASYSHIPSRRGNKTSVVPRDEYLQAWDTVILDEAHYLKNRDAIRTRAVMRVLKGIPRVYLASGTPIPNWAHELFVPLQILWPDEARSGMRFGSYWRWVDKWFITSPSRYARGATEIGRLRGTRARNNPDHCPHYQKFFEENFGDKFLMRRRDEVLTDLPSLTEESIPVPMTTRQWKEYRRMRDEYIAEVDDDTVVAWSSGARHSMLDRITTSLGMLSGNPLEESGKFLQLEEDLSARQRPTLVAAHYQKTVEACGEVARKLGRTTGIIHGGTPPAERARLVKAFQAGDLDVLVGSVETIAEGLTLTQADVLILVEVSYRPSKNEQVIRRIHRIGQTRGCYVRDYVATGPRGQKTLDGSKRALLERKIDGQQSVLRASEFKEML